MGRMMKGLLLTFIILSLILPGAILAQGEAIPIEPGDTVTGAVSEASPRGLYTFSGEAGTRVLISLHSEDSDAYLVLLDADGGVLAEDDDSAGELNALIDFVLPEDGEYTIVATSLGEWLSDGQIFSEGTYVLQLTEDTTPPPAPTAVPPTVEPPSNDEGSDEGMIAVGETVTGILTDDAPSHHYIFNANAGERVIITLSSDTFDTYLVLLDVHGEEFAFDDDSAGNLDARIGLVELPDDGTYTIIVSSYAYLNSEVAVTGDYELSLADGEQPVVDPAPTSAPAVDPPLVEGVLVNGDVIAGRLTEDAPEAAYTFEASEGDVVSVTLASDDFDPYLKLLDVNGALLASDDDSAGNLNALIDGYVIPTDGRYTLVATSYRYSSSGVAVAGGFTVLLEVGDEPVVEPTPDGGDTMLTIGDVVEGELTPAAPYAEYTFFAFAGDVVTVTLESLDFDSYLVLLDDNGVELANNDDAAEGLDAQIASFIIPADGRYVIIAQSFGYAASGETAAGRYTLTLASGDDDEPPVVVVPEAGDISVGDTVYGTLTMDAPRDDYRFYALAGDVVTITLRGEGFDPYLLLLDDAGNEIGRDDDGAGELNARLGQFTIPEDGFYTIVASSYSEIVSNSPSEGDFTLTLAGAEVSPVVYGTIRIGETVDGYLSGESVQYAFEASAGDIVTITLRSTTFDTYVLLYDADGMELMNDDDSAGDLDSRISAYTIPEDGTYTIVVDSFDHATGGETLPEGDYVLALVAAVIDPIEYTQEVMGELGEDASVALYRFSGSAGDLVVVALDTSSPSLNLSLNDPDGYYLMDAYDSSDLGPITLPQTGDYILIVETYDIYTAQPYTLQVDHIIPETITLDTAIETNFDDGLLYYSFEGQAGNSVSVQVYSNGVVDTQVIVNAPDGYEIMRDDDGGAGFDPEIENLILPMDGRYTILVQPYIAGDNGDITVIVKGQGTMALEEAAQVIRISDKNPEGVVVFDAVAGERVLLSARVQVNASDEPRIEIWQGDQLLASNGVGMVERLLIEFVTPEDGPVRIRLVGDYYTAAVIEFSIERLDE